MADIYETSAGERFFVTYRFIEEGIILGIADGKVKERVLPCVKTN